jgi:uncharacterized protein (DUF1501 family)
MMPSGGRGSTLRDGLSRRDVLRVGGLSAFGLSLAQLSHARAAAPAGQLPGSAFGKAKSCIVLFMFGGPPQHETWDPKPDAAVEVRGDLKAISSATPGLQVGELMPLTARLTDRIAVLRAMATDDSSHTSSGYFVLTGYPHSPKNTGVSPPGSGNDRPSLAAMVRHFKRDQSSLPGSVCLPEEIWNTGRVVWPGQDAGWLGAQADPWLMTCDPNQADFRVPDISLPVGVPPERLTQRRALQDLMNRQFQRVDDTGLDRWSTWQAKALELLRNEETHRAFAIDQESQATRDRYGRHRFGQSVLLARRLVEAGVSLVQVNWTRGENEEVTSPVWDTHAKNTQRLKNDLMPPMDQAYSALLEDLEQRGMLEETLVVWVGEFGRSPYLNANAGRDHWGHVFSAALAGGGVQGGAVHGSSDRMGAYPLEGRVEPQDLTATVLHCLGVDPHTLLRDRLDRPQAASKGKPIEAIL